MPSRALQTVNQAMQFRSNMINLEMQEHRLREMRQGVQPTEQDKLDAQNDMVSGYLTHYNHTQEAANILGRTPDMIRAQNNAKQLLRGSISVPLSIAAAGVQMGKQGAGEVAAASTETANLILDAEGYDKDTQDRINKVMVNNSASSNGVRLPSMSLEKQATNVVADLWNVDAEELATGAEIEESTTMAGILERVSNDAVQQFDRLTSSTGVSPEQRITWATTGALQAAREDLSAPQAHYVANTIMERLERRQEVRVVRALSQLPAIQRKYEEEAGVVIQEMMYNIRATGNEVMYHDMLGSIGEMEMLNGMRDPDGLSQTYMNINKQMEVMNKNYEHLNEGQRFSAFVGAFADHAARNVNSGSPIRDQHQLTALERLRSAAESGQMHAKFEGLVGPLTELWGDYEAKHNEVVVARNETIAGFNNKGMVAAVNYDGKVAAWRDINDPQRNQQVANMITDPAVFGLLEDMGRVSKDSNGNHIVNAGDLNMHTLETYQKAMNTGGDWTVLPVQAATPNTPEVTLRAMSDEGKLEWQEAQNRLAGSVYGNYKFFKETKDGQAKNWLKKVEVMDYKGVPLGKIILSHPELTAALRTAEGDLNKINAVLNTALITHYDNVDMATMQTMKQAENELVRDFVDVFPSELRESSRETLLTGDLSAVQSMVPAIQNDIINAHQALTQYEEALNPLIAGRPTPKGTIGSGGFMTAAEHKELTRLKMNKARSMRELDTMGRKLGNYLNEVEKKKELETLQELFGLLPPRSEAFMINAGEAQEEINHFLDIY